MERTKIPKKPKLPDAVNFSPQDFTMIPNTLIRDPNISAKAKAILCLLLSNKDGWHTYIGGLEKMMKEKRDAILSGIRELEEHGFVLRLRYREKKTKVFRGTLWAYTNEKGVFSIAPHVVKLDSYGLEIVGVEPQPDYPAPEKPAPEKPCVKILKKKYQGKNTNDDDDSAASFFPTIPESPNQKITPSQFTQFWESYPLKADKGKALTKWNQICGRKENVPSLKKILSAISSQKETDRWKKRGMIPHPTTWLNQSRWLDDPAQMNDRFRGNGSPDSKNRTRHWDPEKRTYGEPDKIIQS